MAKLLTYLALICLATTIFADDCNNPLLRTFGYTGLNAPTSVSGLKYCKSLQSGLSCCSAETVNAIQDKAQELAKKLSDIVATRDKAIVETRDQIIPGLQASIQQLQENSVKAMTKIMEQLTAALGNLGNGLGGVNVNVGNVGGNMALPFNTSFITGLTASMSGMTANITGNLSAVRSGFRDFQKQRSPCVIELLKLQSAAYCLACDPAWATKGVAGSTVTLGNTACQRIQSACFQFVAESAAQSAVLAMKTVGPLIAQMAASMAAIANSGTFDASALETMFSGFEGGNTVTNASNSTMLPVEIPSGCTEGNCPWICSSMFVNGQIDANAITAGGVQSSSNALSGFRLLAEEDQEVVKRKLLEKRGRALAANEWNPSSDEAGVTITFSDDPAGVGNTGAGLIKVGIISMLAMLAAFIF